MLPSRMSWKHVPSPRAPHFIRHKNQHVDTYLISAHGRLREEDCHDSEATLLYTVREVLARKNGRRACHTGRIAQYVKVLASKPDYKSLIPSTHMMEE